MKVKIKSWREMEAEYGIVGRDNKSSIDCEAGFTRKMEDALPKNRIIDIHKLDKYPAYPVWQHKRDIWSISNDMIEKIIEN